MKSYYDILKVSEDAPQEVVQAAYRAMSKRWHPDKNPGAANAARLMREINKAYETLSDPQSRRAYDRLLERARSVASARPAPADGEAPSPKPSASGSSVHRGPPEGPAAKVPLDTSARPPVLMQNLLISASFYGRFDVDFATKSHVAFYCLAPLMFPLLPLGAYRVRDEGYRLWSVFGRVPLGHYLTLKNLAILYGTHALGYAALIAVIAILAAILG